MCSIANKLYRTQATIKNATLKPIPFVYENSRVLFMFSTPYVPNVIPIIPMKIPPIAALKAVRRSFPHLKNTDTIKGTNMKTTNTSDDNETKRAVKKVVKAKNIGSFPFTNSTVLSTNLRYDFVWLSTPYAPPIVKMKKTLWIL